MHCYKVLSILVFLCLIISLVACLIGTLSREWWCGNFEALVPIYNKTEVPNGYRAHILFDIRFGLTSACWNVRHARLDNDSAPKPFIDPPIKHCISELPDDPVMRDIVKENMAPFRNTLICLIIMIIFNGISFIFASVKLPCLKISKKRMILFTTIILATVAAIAGIIALVIADQNMHYEAPFMKTGLSRPPFMGLTIDAFAMKILHSIFIKVQVADLSDNFDKGVSFHITCVAVAFLILAIILSFIEHCCAQKSGDDEYRSELISDGYSFPEKHGEIDM